MINLLTLTHYSSELRKEQDKAGVTVTKYAKYKAGFTF